MRTYDCHCGNSLFFGSSHCVRCGTQTLMCPLCDHVASIKAVEPNRWRCNHCEAEIRPCRNATEHRVCNRGVATTETESLCTFCNLNAVIPDLDEPDGMQKWFRLEYAKRRVLTGVQRLGFPIDGPKSSQPLKLQFEFKADGAEPVSTGHANGVITINTKEADSVERERIRVAFNEPHRTLVGHFRHELGHYYWQLLVEPNLLTKCRSLFGDETTPTYADAQAAYYANGPKPHWQQSYISAYASMHPWEDFAETFAAYLDMMATLDTTTHFEMSSQEPTTFDDLVREYCRVGFFANELNRDLGLIDLVPEVISKPVVEKMRFVHSIRNLVPA